MLFSRRQSNERDIFRGSCIDVIKSWLRKNLKAPASSRIMPFLQTNKQTKLNWDKTCGVHLLNNSVSYLCKWLNIQINTKKHTQWCEAQTTEKRTWLTPGIRILETGGDTCPPPSLKLNGRSLIIILNLWTLQRAKNVPRYVVYKNSKLTNENIQNY
jgi:hypothetical protein